MAGCAAPETPTTPTAEEETFDWDMQILLPAGEPHVAVVEGFADRIRAASNGRLNITVHPAGAIVGTFEMFDAVSDGLFEMYFANPIYWSGKDPAFAALSDLPTAYTEVWQKEGWYWHSGGIELARDLYAKYNLYYTPLVAVRAGSLHSKKKISSLADFEGLKIRAPTGMMADLLTKAGASVVTVPGGEVYLALETGVVDAAQWGAPAEHWAMGWHEVTNYILYPMPYYQVSAVEVTINMDAWQSLPDDLKTIVESEIRVLSADFVEWATILDNETIEAMIEYGNEWVELPEEEAAKFRDLAVEVWDEWAEKSPAAGEIIASQKDYMRRIGILD